MNKNLLEGTQIFPVRNDVPCLREASKVHALCEWFGPGWTDVLSPLVHVFRPYFENDTRCPSTVAQRERVQQALKEEADAHPSPSAEAWENLDFGEL